MSTTAGSAAAPAFVAAAGGRHARCGENREQRGFRETAAPAWPSLVSLILVIAIGPPPASAQPPTWTIETEASASIFFGNTEQRVIATRASISRADSILEVEAGANFAYADATFDEDTRRVTKRSWLGSLSVDYAPSARYTPFFFGSVEASLEKRIDRRYNAGAGGKLTFTRTEDTEASISLAVVGERTTITPGAVATRPDLLARWSWRVKARHTIDDRLVLSHTTFYRPSVRTGSDFNIASTSALAYQLRESVALTISFIDNYDSEARGRGAESNNDGQVLVGVLATF